MAERTIQTVKQILKKASTNGDLSLLEYRNTPIDEQSGISMSVTHEYEDKKLNPN
jgi:hypothetical protein